MSIILSSYSALTTTKLLEDWRACFESQCGAIASCHTCTTSEHSLALNTIDPDSARNFIKAMLKTLYEAFASLYAEILSKSPTLASEHALGQEQEVYDKSTKLTYRNVRL